MSTKPAEDQQGAKTGDVEECVLGSTLWRLIVCSDRLESNATKAGYQRGRKRQKVETEAERFILVSHCASSDCLYCTGIRDIKQ